jgi:hypothetical protein
MCELILTLHVVKEAIGRLRTDQVPLAAFHRPQAMAPCDSYFSLNLYITNPFFPCSMPQSTGVDGFDYNL